MNPRTQSALTPAFDLCQSPATALVLLLFLAFATACGEKTPAAPDTASLRFTPRIPEAGLPHSVTAEAGLGQITVRSILFGPDPCRTLAGELEQTGREITLRVFVRPNGAEVCIQVVGRFAYDAVIEGLRRGTHDLQVVHTYPSTGWPTGPVLRQTVDVR